MGSAQYGANRHAAENIWVRMTEGGCGGSCLPDTPQCTAEQCEGC